MASASATSASTTPFQAASAPQALDHLHNDIAPRRLALKIHPRLHAFLYDGVLSTVIGCDHHKVDRVGVIRASPLAGLCYDTPSVEAMPFLIGIPDKLSRALSSDLYQEKFPSQLLVEKLRRNICLLQACIQE